MGENFSIFLGPGPGFSTAPGPENIKNQVFVDLSWGPETPSIRSGSSRGFEWYGFHLLGCLGARVMTKNVFITFSLCFFVMILLISHFRGPGALTDRRAKEINRDGFKNRLLRFDFDPKNK